MSINTNFRICILNWNGGLHLRECIDSIKTNGYINRRITVIDNASTDGSVDFLDTELGNGDTDLGSDIGLIRLDSNYGFAQGYQHGLIKMKRGDSAGSNKDEFIIFLNFDTILKNDFLECLAESMQKYSRRDIFGVKILYEDKRDLIWYAGGEVNLKRGMIKHKGLRNNINHINRDSETDYVTGCCMVIHEETFTQLQGFDQDFFMYYEDVELCLRARAVGLKCIYLNTPQIFHKVSVSVGGNYSLKKIIMKMKSAFLLYRKSPSLPTRFSGMLYFLLYTIRTALRLIFRN